MAWGELHEAVKTFYCFKKGIARYACIADMPPDVAEGFEYLMLLEDEGKEAEGFVPEMLALMRAGLLQAN